ncbi:hypothetical protein H6M51_04450 [Rhizobium sp. AQ_MP]|nr:hypothetical protein [Rhizobium sp. AQ_MP]
MAEGPPKTTKSKMLSGAQKQNVNALIATKLRGYYDSIIEEGTPPHLLDLLEQLHNAETEAKSKK